MKKITLLLFMLSFTWLSIAQVGINTITPDASSALDIESTTGGILIPRLSEFQRDAIALPAAGLMIYQTDKNPGFYFYNGTSWTKINGAAGPRGPQGVFGGASFEYQYGGVGPLLSDVDNGFVRFLDTDTQNTATQLQFSELDSNGDSVYSFIEMLNQTQSSTKGVVRLVNKFNSSKNLQFKITNIDFTNATGSTTPGYFIFDVENVASSSLNPFNSLLAASPVVMTYSIFGSDGLQGPQGEQGAQGVQGIQGPIGLTGLTGPSGQDGTNGIDGADGAQGPTGPTGPQGTQGEQGIQGPIGLTGPAGQDGTNGVDGADGADGAQGPTGPQGIQGEQGIQGPIGLTGPQGPQGEQGEQGIQGPIGLTGATGPAGQDGANGIEGADGAQGPIGPTGPQGPQGEQGIQGVQGPIGLTGPSGQDGANGINGEDGAVGTTGAQGPQGDQGIQGEQGDQGEQGPQGDQGEQGIQGPIGVTGPAGQDGTNGIDGVDGQSAYQIWLSRGNTGTEEDFIASLTGPTGPTGPQGAQGVQGVQGPIGLTGFTGPAGQDGINGIDGADGAQGPIGPAGAQGPAGQDGVDGAQGETGPAGATGVAGPTGPPGLQGAPGNDGIDGINGVDGIQGTTGEIGPEGNGVSSTVQNDDGTITFNYTDGTSFTTDNLMGSTGNGASKVLQSIDTSKPTNYIVDNPGPATFQISTNGYSGFYKLTYRFRSGNSSGTSGTGHFSIKDPNGNVLYNSSGSYYGGGQDEKSLAIEIDSSWDYIQLEGYCEPCNGQFIVTPLYVQLVLFNDVVGQTGPAGAQGETGPAGATGVAGPTGPPGSQGAPGNDGQDGENGLDGKNSLIKTSDEPAGTNCTNGGVKLEFGLDVNENGILDTDEINPNLAQFVCSLSNENNTLTLQEQLELGATPWVLMEQGVPKANLYGKNYQGGLIIYLDETTETGMVITDFNVSSNQCPPNYPPNTDYNTSSDFGSGLTNSLNISSLWDNGARKCLDLVHQGYDDWFMPSLDEAILAPQNIPNWDLYEFWSSTQGPIASLPYQRLIQGTSKSNAGSNFCYPEVRAVRICN